MFAFAAFLYCLGANTPRTQLFFRSIFTVFVSIPHLSKKLIIGAFHLHLDTFFQKKSSSNQSGCRLISVFCDQCGFSLKGTTWVPIRPEFLSANVVARAKNFGALIVPFSKKGTCLVRSAFFFKNLG